MGLAHDPEATGRQQQRASSFPPSTPKRRASDKMGRSYRTPSPLRQSHFEFESEVTPKANEHKNRLTIIETPPTSPTLQATPQTPGFKERAFGFFGLLTPSTPGFGDVWKGSAHAVQGSDEGKGDRTPSPCDSGFAKSPTSVGVSGLLAENEVSNLTVPSRKRGRGRKESDASSTFDTDDDEPLVTQYEQMQLEIKKAQLVANLVGETEVSSRRSTRLARKESIKPKPKLATPIVFKESPEPARDLTPPRHVAPPETSFASEAVVPLPADPTPAHRTLDWDLQYPPGGSTHPSYAYPLMDPRLFFDPKVVPVIDGLPSVFKVPTLLLPIGWRHVSWAGFLPIVFDTNHQAFKLTPIGPLPLTCEEVQQSGLAKYVPGGSEHPEAGLMPDISRLSDGSDEIYNFEDVDWALPWPKEENFEPGSVLADAPASSRSASSAQVAIAPKPPSFYDETRDCPDNVVDITDAWRWAEEKELHPNASFVPTPDKSWKNTGVRRTTSKMKSPIASLMGLVIADTIASPNNFIATLLMNQNGRAFCPFRSVATVVYANITLLKDVEITLVELLSYFPNHYFWRKGADRLVRAGFTGSDIANFINWSRALEGDAVKNFGSIKDSLAWEWDSVSQKRIRIERDPDASISYTAEGWQYKVWELIEYPLLGLTHGLKHLPEGPDAGPLTQLIKHCREQGRYRVLLSDVPEMLRELAIEPLIEAGESGDPDKEALGRFAETLKIDRKRVLKDRKDRQAAAEKEAARKKKRVKTE